MKKLLVNFSLFVAIFLIAIVLILLVTPVTPMRKNNMLNYVIKKDSMMEHTPQPRIIIIGGSNVSFGFNSQIIKDSLKVNPVNAGMHAAIGLVYAMNEAKPYIKKGDILIISPEYQQYFGDIAYGGQELLHVIFDVSLQNARYLEPSNYKAFVSYLYYYIRSKTYPHEYMPPRENFYDDTAFNQYGDMYKHWPEGKRNVKPMGGANEEVNLDVVRKMKKFTTEMEEKGATVYITYPGFQAASFDLNASSIDKVGQVLKEYKFKTLGTPEKYKMDDSLIFDTPYHLTREGADIRTRYLIEDLKAAGYK